MVGIDFRRLRREIDMATVLRLLGFRPTCRRGDQLRGPCPVHGSAIDSFHNQSAATSLPARQPGGRSFSVNLAKNACHCFHCGASGNQLDLWAAATRQPLYQAAMDICEKLDHPIPRLEKTPIKLKKSPPPS